MSNVIERMAQLEVPSELLNQVDVEDVLRRFQQNFKNLDDLKNFRSEYEKRNFFKRLITGSELKDKQLNAQEVQGEFSKSLGQLMVISLLQSQRLQEQQSQLAIQQTAIKQHAEKIESNNAELATQQETLIEQADELDRLVKGLLEVRGLTQEGARQLISIASEVKTAKADLLSSFEQSVHEVRQTSERIESETHAAREDLYARLSTHVEEVGATVRGETEYRTSLQREMKGVLQLLDRERSSRVEQFARAEGGLSALRLELQEARQRAETERLWFVSVIAGLKHALIATALAGAAAMAGVYFLLLR